MARIAGVNIPTNKRVLIALQYIHELGNRLVVLVGEGEACHQRHRRQLQLLDLLLHRFGMIDHRMRPEVEAPFLRFRPRRGGDHGQAGEAARQLDQD